ncbi:MAG: carbohydrate binding family 9 domain-containing protein, partial [bacterium]|nr:carbohydrate binding family 9 domain-containing protein [bacterium]
MKKYWNILFCLTVLEFSLFLTDANCQVLNIIRTDQEIVIDGELNEQVWKTVEEQSDFRQYAPKYGEEASLRTILKAVYNNRMIYFAFECTDTDVNRISAKITKRDGGVGGDDSIGIILDTFNDGNNAFMFALNSIGTQFDAKMTDNGTTWDLSWDINWIASCKVSESRWIAEIGIPFEALTFDRNNTVMGFSATRNIPRNLEADFITKNPTNQWRVSEFGKIINLDLTNVETKNYMVIPYFQAQNVKGKDPSTDAGLDLRYNISNQMGADFTYNPDFASIEADVDQVNLTRFELFYPEKRTFFLEGAENYRTPIRQFYSRRIGEIPWGAKLNGKSNQWKYNVLIAQSDPSSVDNNLSSGNDALYTALNVGREINNSSSIRFIAANRGYDNKNQGSFGINSTLLFTKYLGMTSQIINSYGDYNSGSWAYSFKPSYDSRTTHFHIGYTDIGENFQENVNTTGFVRDDNRKEFDTGITKTIWINNNWVDNIRLGNSYNRYNSQNGNLRSWNNNFNFRIKFLRNWDIGFLHIEEFKRYESDFRNRLTETRLNYDNREGFRYEMAFGKGRNFDRDMEMISGGISKNFSRSLNVDYNLTKTWFSPSVNASNSLLHYIRTTYYFNTDLFLKLFYQSRFDMRGEYFDTKFDLDRKTVQLT